MDFFVLLPPPPPSTLFPYTTLFRSLPSDFFIRLRALEDKGLANVKSRPLIATLNGQQATLSIGTTQYFLLKTDRKSTRLNSSHVSISYAVFCLKKKKQRINVYLREE